MLCDLLLFISKISLLSGRDGQFSECIYKLLSFSSASRLHHFVIHVAKILLLGPENTAWSRDTNPTNKVSWWESNMLHDVKSYKSTCSSEACFTMDSDCSFLSLSCSKELVNDTVGRSRAIQEVEVQVLDSMFREFFLVILGLVESHYQRNTHLFENRDIVLWGKRAVFICSIQRTRKTDEFVGNSPVQIAVFHLLVVLVLNNIEFVIIVPTQLDSEVETIQTVVDGAFVSTSAHGCVSEWSEFVVIWLEHFPGFLGTSLKYDDHKSSHEESCISLLGVISARIVVNLISAILLVVYQLLQLFTK